MRHQQEPFTITNGKVTYNHPQFYQCECPTGHAKMAHILILAMPDATVNLFKKVNALAKASLPEKLEKLATMKRGGYAE